MSEHKKFELTPQVSIIIAGIIIAGAVMFTNGQSNAATAQKPQGNQQIPTTETSVRPPSADDHFIGSPSAPLVLIEYSDFQCPFCSLVHPTLKRLVSESNGQIAWIYRHLPLESIHAEARPSALASECVAAQLGNEGFWAFADRMFANQKSLNAAFYEQTAVSLGADLSKFKSCMTAGTYDSRVSLDAKEAMANGGQGTPYTVLYDNKGQVGVSGALPYETFGAVIKAFKERQ